MLVLKITGLVYFAVATMCTVVPDTWFHRDYCRRTKECAEGTHVMCMYYDPFKPMGPVCTENATEVSVGNRYKKLLLNIFNEIRKLAANGEETGKNDKLLPKAYGLKRLKWDDELAVFAQVFANQCSLSRDFCRATLSCIRDTVDTGKHFVGETAKQPKFHSPGQFTGVNVFKFPDWDISELNREGFHHEDKVVAALKNILKRAYFLKKMVTKQLIQNYPDILRTRAMDLFDKATILKQLYKIRPYLNIIHGGTSHVGCGISAYVNRGNFKDQADDGVYNIVELTCNFSGEPTPESPVYETIRPKRLGWSTMCGCPPGYSEDEDCLCADYETRTKDEADSGRAARVMSLLHSFATKEGKLYNTQPITPGNARRNNPTYNVLQPNSDIAAHAPTNLEAILSSLKEKILNKQLRKFIDQDIGPEYLDKKLNEVPKLIYRRSRSPTPQLRKTSIFSRVNNFALPIQHVNTDLLQTYRTEPFTTISNPVGGNNEFHQVRPRKDFSKMSELVTEYVNKRRSRKSPPVVNFVSQNRKLKSEQHTNKQTTKQTTTPETMIIKQPVHYTMKEAGHRTKKESDNLFNLLDKLEQEVKYIELNEHVKEIIDKKMRKIYDSVIHDPKRLMTPEQSDVVDGLIKILKNNPDDLMGIDPEMPTTGVQLTRLLSKNLNEMRKDRVKFVENSPDSNGKVNDQMGYDVDSTTTDVYLPSPLNVNEDDGSKFIENSPDSDRKGDDLITYDSDTPTTEGTLTSLIKKNHNEMRQDRTKFIAHIADSTGKGDIYDSFYRDDKISLDDKLDAYYKNEANRHSGATKREMIRDFAIRDADEILGSIRRKFYQDKLKNLKRKLESMRGYTRPNDDEQNNSDNRPKSPFTTSQELSNTWSSSTTQNFSLNRPALLTGFEAE